MTAEEKARVEREWKALDAIDGAPDYLGREVLRWLAAHPTDARRRRLSIASCGRRGSAAPTDASGDVSREAFTVLQKSFPASEWAKKTPYWFR